LIEERRDVARAIEAIWHIEAAKVIGGVAVWRVEVTPK
jgi:hypothetical protein